MSAPPRHDPETLTQRRAYYERIAERSMTPLWEVLGALVPPHPKPEARPAIWRYAEVRDHVMEAGRLITAEEAERRVLILENPALRGSSCITSSLYAGLQLIMPGEVAPAHRHTQSALRLVLDGEGAYTAVDGERTTMRRGDFIVTPSWTWHDHGNLGDQPVVWLDGLDIPMLRFFGAGFAERSEQRSQSELRAEGDALARYGANLVPHDYEPKPSEPTRLFVWPYSRTRESLAAMAAGGTPDAHHAFRMRHVNPATGASPMATIGTFSQRLPAGFETRPYRSTDGSVHVCLDGSGEAVIDGSAYPFGESDIFVVPPWSELVLRAGPETTLFSFSDRPVQRALGIWREQRG